MTLAFVLSIARLSCSSAEIPSLHSPVATRHSPAATRHWSRRPPRPAGTGPAQILLPFHAASSLNSLAVILDTIAESDETEAMYLQTVAIYEKKGGPEHLDLAPVLENLGIYTLIEVNPRRLNLLYSVF